MVEFKKLSNGFVYIEVQNSSACANIALQGGHIFHYQRKGEERILWLSEESEFEEGKAIRGGVPICWPSFGMNNPQLPQHGFARGAMWELSEVKELDDTLTQLTLKLYDTKESLELWNYRFELQLKITVSDKLTMELTTLNKDSKAFKITQALHTYFQISHISNISVSGLEEKPYFDALTSKQAVQNGEITFDKETDRVYQYVDREIVLKDKKRSICIKNEGSSSCVVWNPWIEKCKRMSAMSDDSYENFVCIESSNAFEDFYILEPGGRHTLKATIS